MMRYFKEDLKLSIKSEIDQDDSQLIDYKKLVAKAVKAEAKADLHSRSYMRETDLSCLRGNQPAYIIAHKVQIKGAVKDHCSDDSKASKGSASTPISASIQDSKPSDKVKKDKKKKYWRGKRDSRESKDSTIPASGVNMAEVEGKKKKKNKKNVSEITCFNCNKKRHYSNKCLMLPKN